MKSKFKIHPVKSNPYFTRIYPVKLFTMFNLSYSTWNSYFTGIIFLLIIFFIFFCVVENSQAAPSISSVSGDFSEGNVLVISGTDMLNEDDTDWYFSVSESRCEGDTPYDDGWSGYQNAYTTDISLTGTKSIPFNIANGNGGTNCPTDNRGNYNWVFFFDEDYEYSRSYVRYSSNFDTVFSTAAYVKMNYWTAWSGYVQPASGAGWPTSLTVKIYADTEYLPLPYTWEGERWICVEARANLDSGTIEVWIDGESIGIHSGTFYTEGGPANWQLGIVNACPMPAGSYTMWADSATISKSRIYPATIVEVGDSSNYETANKNKQVLEKAGDEQIEFVLDTTGLGVGPYYVWVTNNRQERSLAWVEDTASDTTPPSHPTGLSVD